MKIFPDVKYNPENENFITSKTKLGDGITIAKFLGSYSDKTSFNHIKNNSKRRQIARNLTLHARAMQMINGNTERFNDVRIIVSEGIYNRNTSDIKEGSDGELVMYKKANGLLVYYQVIGVDGKIDLEQTFDVAEYWKDHIRYNHLYLDYDEYNWDGTLTAQIGLEVPLVPSEYKVNFKQEISTVFNNNVFAKNEFIECLGRPADPSKNQEI